jgi:hypothetical protein
MNSTKALQKYRAKIYANPVLYQNHLAKQRARNRKNKKTIRSYRTWFISEMKEAIQHKKQMTWEQVGAIFNVKGQCIKRAVLRYLKG